MYVANFILMDYGTGAIFGCPAHDQRDLDFANKYGLGNTPVVCPPEQDPATFVITDTAYEGDGRMINSRFLDGMTIEQAKEVVARRLEHTSRGNRPVATQCGLTTQVCRRRNVSRSPADSKLRSGVASPPSRRDQPWPRPVVKRAQGAAGVRWRNVASCC